MPSFFRLRILSATEARAGGDIIRDLRGEAIDGVLLRGVYDKIECDRICATLAAGDHGLMRTDFPAPFHSYFLGQNLNLAPPDLDPYFQAALPFHEGLARVFGDSEAPQTRIARSLSRLDGGRAYRAAPGPDDRHEHMFLTLRAQLRGGFIPQHFDDEQSERPSYRYVAPRVVSDLFSYVLAFSIADEGGALEVFNLRPGGARFRMDDGPQSAGRLNIEGVESVLFRLEPGDMIVFNSGRLLHRVTPVVGGTTRWTACSFMADGRDGDVLCWG